MVPAGGEARSRNPLSMLQREKTENPFRDGVTGASGSFNPMQLLVDRSATPVQLQDNGLAGQVAQRVLTPLKGKSSGRLPGRRDKINKKIKNYNEKPKKKTTGYLQEIMDKCDKWYVDVEGELEKLEKEPSKDPQKKKEGLEAKLREIDGLRIEIQHEMRSLAPASSSAVMSTLPLATSSGISSTGASSSAVPLEVKEEKKQKARVEEESAGGIAVAELLQFIEAARNAILSGDYQGACSMLTNSDRVAGLGLHLDKKVMYFDTEDPGRPDYGDNMYFNKSKKVRIAVYANPKVDIQDVRLKDKVFTAHPDFWKPLLMGTLEEFIHAWQNATDSYLSPSTDAYKREKAASLPGTTSYNEIDILAVMEDWKMEPEKAGFHKAHEQDRLPYWKWRYPERDFPVSDSGDKSGDVDEFADF